MYQQQPYQYPQAGYQYSWSGYGQAPGPPSESTSVPRAEQPASGAAPAAQNPAATNAYPPQYNYGNQPYWQGHHAQQPAQHTVSAAPQLRTQSQPAYVKVNPTPAAASKAPANGEHPPSLRNFVMRFFARGSVTDAEKDALRKLIADAKDKGELWTRDWDNTPLPTINRAPTAAHTPTITAMPAPPRPPVTLRATGPRGGPLGGGALAKDKAQAAAAALSSQLKRQRVDIGPPPLQPMSKKQAKKAAALARKQAAAAAAAAQLQQQQHRAASSDEEAPVDAREAARRQRRAGRFGDGATDDFASNRTKALRAAAVHEARRRRAAEALAEQEADEVDWDSLVIRGTCQNLEKSYFRLTSAPDPATVRPEAVVRRAYERLVGLLAGGAVNYFYALDQFKGQRQDLTVQHIKNDLTMQVYEAHARAALEYGDLPEFNQCQTQVHALHRAGVSGATHEFLAYRLLYQTVHARHGQGAALLSTLQELTKQDVASPAVQHALAVRAAVARYDWVAFFRLYASAPALGRCLMDVHVSAMRRHAADSYTKACKPTLPVAHIARVLGFLQQPGDVAVVSDETVLPGCTRPAATCGKHTAAADLEAGLEQCLSWLAASNASITGPDAAGALLDCKASAGNIVTPADTEAVAHGDANLAIDDFLSKAL